MQPDDPHALQPYSKHPDPYGDLRRDYMRVMAERDGLRAENARLRTSLSDCLLMLEPVASADIWDTPYEFYSEHEAAQAACVTARAVLGLTAPDSSATLSPEP